jgi:gas vesicle structural protein
MAIATQRGGYIDRPRPSGLADVIDVILDKGIVIDAFVRVSLIGIEILTIDARIVIASVDTYLRFAEAVNRLDIVADTQSKGLPELVQDMTEGGASSKVKGLASGAKEALFGDDDDDSNSDSESDSDDSGSSSSRRRSSSSSRSSSSRSRSGSGSGGGSRRRSSGSGGSSSS